ncbi:MAG TPA: iron transporter, partial [Isosphaeraceae bacterium]|nr:iron transporter [Isosphaeraceae bacterium]
IVYPDREEDQLGTLFIPNTLARIKGAAHPDEAEALAGYLLSPQVEAKLAESTASQIPLNPKTPTSAKVETPRTVHAMDADFEKAAEIWETQVAPFLAREFSAAP